MIMFGLRIVLSALFIVFAGWLGYIIYLGLNRFLSIKNDNKNMKESEDGGMS